MFAQFAGGEVTAGSSPDSSAATRVSVYPSTNKTPPHIHLLINYQHLSN